MAVGPGAFGEADGVEQGPALRSERKGAGNGRQGGEGGHLRDGHPLGCGFIQCPGAGSLCGESGGGEKAQACGCSCNGTCNGKKLLGALKNRQDGSSGGRYGSGRVRVRSFRRRPVFKLRLKPDS